YEYDLPRQYEEYPQSLPKRSVIYPRIFPDLYLRPSPCNSQNFTARFDRYASRSAIVTKARHVERTFACLQCHNLAPSPTRSPGVPPTPPPHNPHPQSPKKPSQPSPTPPNSNISPRSTPSSSHIQTPSRPLCLSLLLSIE
ncbi:hypothetical protein CVT26_015607, partial [Gymnopilus dilepis]